MFFSILFLEADFATTGLLLTRSHDVCDSEVPLVENIEIFH